MQILRTSICSPPGESFFSAQLRLLRIVSGSENSHFLRENAKSAKSGGGLNWSAVWPERAGNFTGVPYRRRPVAGFSSLAPAAGDPKNGGCRPTRDRVPGQVGRRPHRGGSRGGPEGWPAAERRDAPHSGAIRRRCIPFPTGRSTCSTRRRREHQKE